MKTLKKYHLQKTLISLSILAGFTPPSQAQLALDTTIDKSGSYAEDVLVDLSSKSGGEVDGVLLTGNKKSSNLIFEKNLTVHVSNGLNTSGENSVMGFRIEDDQLASNVYVKGDLTINADATGFAYGMLVGSAYHFGIGPDADYKGGKTNVDGSVNIKVHSGTRGAGIVGGSWFGNSGSDTTAANITLGSSSSHNTISVSGGQNSHANPPAPELLTGILGYAGRYATSQANININGNTDIYVQSDNKFGAADINYGTIGVYAAHQSNISFIGPQSDLTITVSGNDMVKRRLDGIVAGLYDAAFHSKTPSTISINQANTHITLQNGGKASGILAVGGSQININSNVFIQSSNVTSFTGIKASNYVTQWPGSNKGGHINIIGGFSTVFEAGTDLTNDTLVAIHSDGYNCRGSNEASIIIDGTNAQSQIQGAIRATEGGIVNVTIDGQQSFINGHIDQRYIMATGKYDPTDKNNGNITLTLKNGATWHNLENKNSYNGKFFDGISTLNALNMQGGTINMSDVGIAEGWHHSSYQQIIMQSLTGDNRLDQGQSGTFVMDINLADESDLALSSSTQYKLATDQIVINGAATGNYNAKIHFVDGLASIDPAKMYSQNWLISQGEASDMTIHGPDAKNDAFTGNGMISMWTIRFVKDGEEALLDTQDGRDSLSNHGVGAGKWHLIRYDHEETLPPDVIPPEEILPPEVDNIITVGNTLGQAIGWLSEREDLRHRLGEVRYGAQTGAWVKGFYRKDNTEGFANHAFKSQSSGIHFGYDHLATANEDSAWIVGGALRYADTNQKNVETANRGQAQLNEYSAKAYATWLYKNGMYADFVLQAGRYDQEMTGLTNDLSHIWNASYKTWGTGASVEFGQMFKLGSDSLDDRDWYDHFFIEPQLQLSYFYVKGKDFSTSTNMQVSQDNADFLTGRAGVVLGKKWTFGTQDELDPRYFQTNIIAGITHEFMGDQSIKFTGIDGISKTVKGRGLGGTAYYYGFQTDWQIRDDMKLYAEISREEGKHYTKELSAHIGMKFSFE